MDVLTLLKKDHTLVKGLFKEVEALGDRATSSRKSLFQEIDRELSLHAEVEEKIFYPAFKKRAKKSDEKDEVLEAYEEHALVKTLMGELETLDPKDETYKAKLQVLSELVLHHAKEEESEMFKMAREMFDKEELEDLGEQVAAAKERALAPA
ncbi:MAG: hemerythrin domain-containing protein [Candidatus Eremiobacteraeota bacterium]|nr:hemerythrin domain-containing protein [Candidatus Eremiobacteraeota bacterium]